VGPGVEETLKLMGVVVLFLMASAEFDGVLDGFVYGAMVGLGFTVVEDVSYFIRHVVDAGSTTVDQAGPVIDTFLIRVVGGGLYGHVLFTGLTGTGFAYLVTKRSTPMPRRIAGAALCMAAGVTAHVVWNSPWMESVLGSDPSVLQWIEYGAIKGMPFLILLGILVVLATRSEESNFRSIVAGEPDPAVITDDEVRSLRSLWTRRSARSAAGRLRGPAARRLTGRLQSAQIEYAMIRSRADSLTDPALAVQRHRVRSIRAELAALAALPAVPVSVPAPVQWAAPKPAWGQPTGGTPWPGHAPAPNSPPAAVSPALPVAEPVREPAATPAAEPAAAEPEVGRPASLKSTALPSLAPSPSQWSRLPSDRQSSLQSIRRRSSLLRLRPMSHRPRRRPRCRCGRRATSCPQVGCRPGMRPSQRASRWRYSRNVSSSSSFPGPERGPRFGVSTAGPAGWMAAASSSGAGREAAGARTTDTAGVRPLANFERRLIGYRLVRLLDSPDEYRSTEIGIVDQGDEVQLLERRGVYWLVLCPDGRQGWVHRMTLAEPVQPDVTVEPEPMPQYMDDDIELLAGPAVEPSTNGLLDAYLKARGEIT
jgi:hypothetical protein